MKDLTATRSQRFRLVSRDWLHDRAKDEVLRKKGRAVFDPARNHNVNIAWN